MALRAGDLRADFFAADLRAGALRADFLAAGRFLAGALRVAFFTALVALRATFLTAFTAFFTFTVRAAFLPAATRLGDLRAVDLRA